MILKKSEAPNKNLNGELCETSLLTADTSALSCENKNLATMKVSTNSVDQGPEHLHYVRPSVCLSQLQSAEQTTGWSTQEPQNSSAILISSSTGRLGILRTNSDSS